jgi:uncharacterized protein YabN with tetrapyrrole methylase and pyrophosphatase domain
MTSSPSKDCLLKQTEELEISAKEFGFYWERIEQLIEQIQSECLEVKEAWENNDNAHLQEEIGDLIHATISLAVFCQFDPHETLANSLEKFQKRYNHVVHLAKEDGHSDLKQQPMDILMHYWNRAKVFTKKPK